jgi:methyl-accepting chemotaxis protein
MPFISRGEVGRGFGVVAGEVKHLAGQTATAGA